MKRKFSNWSNNRKKNLNNKLEIFNKSTSSLNKNLWLMKWSQKKLFPCCNMNLTSKSKPMKVYKDSILNKKSSMRKNKLNLFKRMNSFPNLLMKKGKTCKKESMMFLKKNLRSKNKLLHSLIKKMKLLTFPNKKIKKSHLSKIKLFNLIKKLKKLNNSAEPRSLNFKMSLWKKSSIMKKRLLSTNKKMSFWPRKIKNFKNSLKTNQKLMNKKSNLSKHNFN